MPAITIGINDKTVAATTLGIAFLSILLAFQARGLGVLQIAIVAIGILSLLLDAVVYKVGFIILPFITRILKVREIRTGGFEIPPSQDVILKNVGGVYYAIQFMYARLYESASVGVQDEQSSYMDLWERAVASVYFPFKFCVLTFLEDILKFREDVETRRAAAQLRLGREREKPRPDAITIDKWEREVAKQNELLARLSAGEKPLGTLMYITTLAIGVSPDAATAIVKGQANELKATFSNALNVEILELKGEDMKRCFDWEIAFPSTLKDLKGSI
ncbi:hypothetical protein H0N98_00680 [Candidatus Micrarchaeota archaeon]|nr:hypothetical protein [Candidatus Micrarchaeota archaeon]